MRAYERMLNYVKINTESAEGTGTSPSTQRQWDLVRLLEREMGELDLGKLHFGELIVVEQFVESVGKTAFQSGTRRQTGSKRYIAGKHCIETFHLTTALDYLAAHAEYVARPLL